VHHRFADAEFGGQFAARPMRRSVARLAAGCCENPGAQLRSELGSFLAGTMGFEAVEALFEEAFLPA